MDPILALVLFGLVFLLVLTGFPVAFVLGGTSLVFGLFTLEPHFLAFLPSRIMGTMSNTVLMAVPLFVFMGIMLEKSGLANKMLSTMGLLLGNLKGGLAISVVIVGALLAASTGIVGATVITMGLISLPTMLKRGYKPELATGTIAASGTLGQIIPPSVLLVLLGSVLQVDVGALFKAAVLPGLLLVIGYMLYITAIAWWKPQLAPPIPKEELQDFWGRPNKVIAREVAIAFLMPMLLILAVLGSIFAGIASPTEAAAVGAFGAGLLTWITLRGEKKSTLLTLLKEVAQQTTKISSMVFFIIIGASIFSLVFRKLGGETYLLDLLQQANLGPWAFLAIVMGVVFVAGFFIDFIEIIYIIVPVVAPLFRQYIEQGDGVFGTTMVGNENMGLVWVGILLAMNLQTSFLTPPFGFSLFYLKGIAPPSITTGILYRGIIPFIAIQLVVLFFIVMFPQLVLAWL
ncbi:MAG: TRAP transporter large permease subunit [Bacteroidia bacterium]|nr:TRAP transporter large permease subunit [Bacteroidia bacterium]